MLPNQELFRSHPEIFRRKDTPRYRPMDRIQQIEAQIKELSREKMNLIYDKIKEGFKPGDRIKLTRTVYNLNSGQEEQQEYFLFIKSSYYNVKTALFEYTFSHVTSLGKPSKGKCGIYHHSKTDKICLIG